MITLKVYQVFKDRFDEYDQPIPEDKRTFKVLEIGTVEIPNEKVSEDSIWEAFNWTCWMGEISYDIGLNEGVVRDDIKAHPNKNAKGFCNEDITFQLGDKWKVPKFIGWTDVDTYEDAIKLIKSKMW